MWTEKEEAMTKREMKAFFKRTDVKIAIGMLIAGIEYFAYLEQNWKFMICFSLVILIVLFSYLCIRAEMKDNRKKALRRG